MVQGHGEPALPATAAGLHLDLAHGGVEALYVLPLAGWEESLGEGDGERIIATRQSEERGLRTGMGGVMRGGR